MKKCISTLVIAQGHTGDSKVTLKLFRLMTPNWIILAVRLNASIQQTLHVTNSNTSC